MSFKTKAKGPKYEYLHKCSVCGDEIWFSIKLPSRLREPHTLGPTNHCGYALRLCMGWLLTAKERSRVSILGWNLYVVGCIVFAHQQGARDIAAHIARGLFPAEYSTNERVYNAIRPLMKEMGAWK